MYVALTRLPRWTDQPLHPQERITREQAIRLYTINNAFLLFDETQKGSLEPGKLADFVITAKDVLTCSLEELRDMTVERTYLGGRRVH
jgi:predicted amidohydrolase YtcJ